MVNPIFSGVGSERMLRLHVLEAPARHGPTLVLYMQEPSGEESVVVNMEMERIRPGERISDKAFFPLADQAIRELAKYMVRWDFIPKDKNDSDIKRLTDKVASLTEHIAEQDKLIEAYKEQVSQLLGNLKAFTPV